MTNIVYSPGLQAPIVLVNPTGVIALPGSSPIVVAQHNPTPDQCVATIVGAAVKLALGMTALTGVASFGAPVPSVISGHVTTRNPTAGSVVTSSAAPSVTQTTQSGGINQTFPRVALTGNGGDATFGGSGMTSGTWSYTTAGPGTTVYNAIQQLGSWDMLMPIGASYEGWQHGNYNKQQLVTAIMGQGSNPIIKNASRPTMVALYAVMESSSNLAADNGYETFNNLINANNWWTYLTPGGTGTLLGSPFANYNIVNYTYQWNAASADTPNDSPVCGNAYGTLWNGFSCAQTAGIYFASALLTLNPQNTAFQSLTNGAAPNAIGIMWDNFFLYPNGGGNYSSTTASWDGVGTQSNTTPGAYPSGVSSMLARGQYHCLQQMQSYLAQCNPGKTYYNLANFGNYANPVGLGNIATITANAINNTFHGGLWEEVFGVASASLQSFQTFAQVMQNYTSIMAFCQSPQLVCVQGLLPATDGSTTAVYTINGTPTTITSGTALEYQAMRLVTCFAYMLNGYATFGVDGYDWSKVRWYDEFGDDSLTQVNVKRGYLGQPTAAYTTLSNGVLVRPFQNGYVMLNPWGNGAQTVTLAMLTAAFGVTSLAYLKGTQQTSINSGLAYSSHTFADADGLIVLDTTPITITIANPLNPQATVGAAYTKQMSASGGVAPYTWAVSASPSIPGLSFTSAGAFNFTPSTSGTFSLTFTVTDSIGDVLTSSPYTLVINPAASSFGTPAYYNNFSTLANGADSPFNTMDFATVTNAQSFNPPNSVISTVTKSGFNFGGAYGLPTTNEPVVGNKIWFRLRLLFPVGFDFSAGGGPATNALKWMRVDTMPSPSSTDHSHIDWYLMDGNTSGVGTLDWIYEGTPSGGPAGTGWLFGGAGGGTGIPSQIVRGQWITYEVAYTLGTTAATSRIQLWINGVLKCDTGANLPAGVAKLPTMLQANTVYGARGNPGGFMWTTYWNKGAHATQSGYCGSIAIFTDITGIPGARDAAGNPFIGMGDPS